MGLVIRWKVATIESSSMTSHSQYLSLYYSLALCYLFDRHSSPSPCSEIERGLEVESGANRKSTPHSHSTIVHTTGLSCTVQPQHTTRQTTGDRSEQSAYAVAFVIKQKNLRRKKRNTALLNLKLEMSHVYESDSVYAKCACYSFKVDGARYETRYSLYFG